MALSRSPRGNVEWRLGDRWWSFPLSCSLLVLLSGEHMVVEAFAIFYCTEDYACEDRLFYAAAPEELPRLGADWLPACPAVCCRLVRGVELCNGAPRNLQAVVILEARESDLRLRFFHAHDGDLNLEPNLQNK